MTDSDRAGRWFHWSIGLTLAGLIVELLSLFGLQHPVGFMAFAAFGCTLMGAGIVLFVLSLLSRAPASPPGTE